MAIDRHARRRERSDEAQCFGEEVVDEMGGMFQGMWKATPNWMKTLFFVFLAFGGLALITFVVALVNAVN